MLTAFSLSLSLSLSCLYDQSINHSSKGTWPIMKDHLTNPSINHHVRSLDRSINLITWSHGSLDQSINQSIHLINALRHDIITNIQSIIIKDSLITSITWPFEQVTLDPSNRSLDPWVTLDRWSRSLDHDVIHHVIHHVMDDVISGSSRSKVKVKGQGQKVKGHLTPDQGHLTMTSSITWSMTSFPVCRSASAMLLNLFPFYSRFARSAKP